MEKSIPRKKPTKRPNLQVVREVPQVTRDEQLRRNIHQFMAMYHDLPDEEYQYKLSKLLAVVDCTDTGNAIRYHARYSSKFRYVHEWKRWIVWNGRQWLEDYEGAVIEHAQRIGAYVEMEADVLPPPSDINGEPLMYPTVSIVDSLTPQQRDILEKFAIYEKQVANLKNWAKVSRSRRSLESMVEILKSISGMTITANSLDKNEYLLNCRNCTIDLRTGEALPHDKENYNTKIANVDYDPTAAAPEWDKFVSKVMKGRAGLVRFLQQLSGEGMVGTQIDDILPVHHGQGGNGKDVYTLTLIEMLGTYAGTASTELFLERKNETISNDLADTKGVRLLIASETKEGRHLDEALVKLMTGGGYITARRLHENNVTFKPVFTPFLLTNHKPIIKGIDKGIWRRLKLIPWDHDFMLDPDKKDKNVVLSELRNELPGILNWCIAGLSDRLHNGLNCPIEVTEATEQYRATSDILGQFIEECCIVGRDHEVVKGELYTRYEQWMKDENHYPQASNKFSEKLKERGFEARKSGGTRFWRGIRLRTVDDPVEDAPPDESQDSSYSEVI